jgi:hypothetical protein
LRLLGNAGSSYTILNMTAAVLPEKGFCPVSMLKIMMPKEKMSVRASTSPPLTCSGDIKEGVPMIPMVRATPSRASILAMPKSVILARPSSVTRMFAGFKSRWMT